MHLLTTLLSCLLALLGGEVTGTTRITRIAGPGEGAVFSKATVLDGAATFECFGSASGRCHYRLYEERCGTPGVTGDCQRRPLDAFALAVGQRHRVEGLPAGFGHCVATADAATCR
ncbi:hypothetical protein [Pseudoxanthomonas sp. 10H]|uniref:hypothetical protein n=1 Tax=Pseudoxanthomonas sp. 10H TaxID=3242729 RepID=UPI003558646A